MLVRAWEEFARWNKPYRPKSLMIHIHTGKRECLLVVNRDGTVDDWRPNSIPMLKERSWLEALTIILYILQDPCVESSSVSSGWDGAGRQPSGKGRIPCLVFGQRSWINRSEGEWRKDSNWSARSSVEKLMRRGKRGVKPFDGVGKDFANHNKVGLTFVRGLERWDRWCRPPSVSLSVK